MSKKKLVLAFSGGLDTTYCVKYLAEDRGFEVHTVIVDTGGFSAEELVDIERKAYELGVSKHTCVYQTPEILPRVHQVHDIWQCVEKQHLSTICIS